jgi:hypothetical protein
MHRLFWSLAVLQFFFLQQLINAEYKISSWYVTLKPILMTPQTTSTYGITLDGKMLDEILHVVDKSDMPL